MLDRERTRLKLIIRDRINELALMRHPGDDSDDTRDDDAARLDQLISSDVSSAVSSAALRNLRRLRENLAWLDSDDGGLCDACGCEIAVARLEAMPTTRLCVNCADKEEQRH